MAKNSRLPTAPKGLYHLTDDIAEKTNLDAKHPEIAQKLLGLLRRDGLLEE